MPDSNILKEAIADAKAVRQTALANAKVALEEAFSERYHAMFADKLKEETEQDETAHGNMPDVAAQPEENVSEQEIDELIKELEAEVGDKAEAEPQFDVPVTPAVPGAPVVAPTAGTPAVPGAVPPGCPPVAAPAVPGVAPLAPVGEPVPPVAPAPVDVTAPAVTPPPSEVPPPAGEEADEDVDLNELLESLKEEVEKEEYQEEEEAKELDERKELKSSDIAPGGNKKPSSSASSSADLESKTMTNRGVPGGHVTSQDPVEASKSEKNFDGNIDGNMASHAALKEGIGLKDKGVPGGKQTHSGDDPTEVTKSEKNFDGNIDGDLASHAALKEENKILKKQLSEAYDVVKYVKGQLNEVNLLNAKLLYTNKLFKEFTMANEQKMRIVEMFDLAKNVREVKLTYANIAESLNFGGETVKKKVPKTSANVQSITEGLASQPVGSTKPKGIISEGKANQMVSKFQKLAGIKKS